MMMDDSDTFCSREHALQNRRKEKKRRVFWRCTESFYCATMDLVRSYDLSIRSRCRIWILLSIVVLCKIGFTQSASRMFSNIVVLTPIRLFRHQKQQQMHTESRKLLFTPQGNEDITICPNVGGGSSNCFCPGSFLQRPQGEGCILQCPADGNGCQGGLLQCRTGDDCYVECPDNQVCLGSAMDLSTAGCSTVSCVGQESWYQFHCVHILRTR